MRSERNEVYRISFGEFVIAFVPFGIFLGTALLAAEKTLDLGLYRTIYTIWVTTALATPALCAFFLPGNSARKQNIWILFWTFSFLAYLVHMAYAIFSVYHGSFHEFVSGQGVFPAIINIVFTLWWTLDVMLAWLSDNQSRWIHIQRVAAHIFIALTFLAATIVLNHGFIRVIGLLMTAAIAVSLMIRYDAVHSRKLTT
jgi:hypothetical protein